MRAAERAVVRAAEVNDEAAAAGVTDSTAGASTTERGWLRRLWSTIRPHRRNVFIAFGSAGLATVGLVYTPIVVRSLVDGSIRRDDGTLTKWLLVLVVLAVLRGATIFGRRWYGGQVSIDVEADLRRAIHDHLQTLDPGTHDALAQGQVVSRVTMPFAEAKAFAESLGTVLDQHGKKFTEK